MTAGAVLLKAIRDEPDNDAHRLAYADWLENEYYHGRLTDAEFDRARFIRVQCELDSNPNLSFDERERLDLQEHQLLVQHGKEWKTPLTDLGAGIVMFQRGFPMAISISCRDFLDNGDKILSIAPITTARIAGLQRIEDVRDLAATPALSRLTRQVMLDVDCDGDQAARAIADSPHLSRLRTLVMQRCGMTDAGAQALAGSAHLGGLAELDLSHNHIQNSGALRLATTQQMPNLVTLILRGNPVGQHLSEFLDRQFTARRHQTHQNHGAGRER